MYDLHKMSLQFLTPNLGERTRLEVFVCPKAAMHGHVRKTCRMIILEIYLCVEGIGSTANGKLLRIFISLMYLSDQVSH